MSSLRNVTITPGTLMMHEVSNNIYFIAACQSLTRSTTTESYFRVYLLSKRWTGWWNIDENSDFWEIIT